MRERERKYSTGKGKRTGDSLLCHSSYMCMHTRLIKKILFLNSNYFFEYYVLKISYRQRQQ
jgi:hypothetical protein